MRVRMNKENTITVGYRIYYKLKSPMRFQNSTCDFKTPFNYDLNLNVAKPYVALHLTLHYEISPHSQVSQCLRRLPLPTII